MWRIKRLDCSWTWGVEICVGVGSDMGNLNATMHIERKGHEDNFREIKHLGYVRSWQRKLLHYVR
jgi:hypothetical protein